MRQILTEPVSGPTAWRSADLPTEKAWLIPLDDDVVKDLEGAADAALRSGLPMAEVTSERFPAPSFARMVPALLETLERGHGFLVLRRLPVESYPAEMAEMVYWCLGAHLGVATTQNSKGDLLTHVRDEKRGGLENTSLRAYQTRDALPFHTDDPDVAALLCLRPSPHGGQSLIASTATVYNELLSGHREYLGVYYTGVFYDARGEEPPGALPAYRNAIFGYFDGLLTCRYYLRTYAESAQEKIGIALTPVEREALDLFEEIAGREENHVSMSLETGDVQLVDNNVVVHARTGYRDRDDEQARHLVRLWLNLRHGRKIPPHLAIHRDGMTGHDAFVRPGPRPAPAVP
jgi:hypothetical protein